MPEFRFKQVDVFSAVPFKGAPVAVVFDPDQQLSTEQMQQIAKWTNLSETTFVVPKRSIQADYRLRIFTPCFELPFAGHPTIGTAHALLEEGLIQPNPDGNFIQECNAGLIKMSINKSSDQPWISFELPQPKITQLDAVESEEVKKLFKSSSSSVFNEQPPLLVDVGPRWIVLQMRNAQAVLAAEPDLQKMKEFNERTNSTGVVIFGEYLDEKAAAKIEVRAFAPLDGINEDPVCGSGNGCVAVYIRATGQLAHIGNSYLASQGARVGRAGFIRVTVDEDGDRVLVAGMAVTRVDGKLMM